MKSLKVKARASRGGIDNDTVIKSFTGNFADIVKHCGESPQE